MNTTLHNLRVRHALKGLETRKKNIEGILRKLRTLENVGPWCHAVGVLESIEAEIGYYNSLIIKAS